MTVNVLTLVLTSNDTNSEQDRQRTYNVTLRRIHVTTDGMEKQWN